MQVRDLTETECQEVLQRLNLGRIACAKDNQPYVVPAYFYLDGRYLYSFGTLGQKIEWMRANPRVCVEVDETTRRLALDDRACVWVLRGAARHT